MIGEKTYLELLEHLKPNEVRNITCGLRDYIAGRLQEGPPSLPDIVADQVLLRFEGWDAEAVRIAKNFLKQRRSK